MAPQTTFNIGAKLAVETDRGSAPSGTALNGRPWWEGGRWFDVVTDGFPNARNMQAVIFPAGHAGDRRINQQPPVVGRRWSEAEMSAPVVADYLGAILYGVMGAASTNMTLHTTASLLAASIIETNPRSFNLTNQPNEGGAILRFELKGGASNGSISISGINVEGVGASEVISFGSGNITVYSRTSWSAIAAAAGGCGIAVSGVSTGSVTIIAVKSFTHTFTTASSAPTLAIEQLGDPMAGAASQSWVFPGQLVRELTFTNNAAQTDGVFMMNFSTVGEPTTAACTATTLNAPSPLKIWPAWFMQISRDGLTWNKVSNFTYTNGTGNRNTFSAANAQGPQSGLIGGAEFSGDITIYVDDEAEYNRWRGASEMQLHAMFGSGNNQGWKLTSALEYTLNASLPCYIGDITRGEDDGAQTITFPYRVVRNDSYPHQWSLVNGTPQKSYGAGTGI